MKLNDAEIYNLLRQVHGRMTGVIQEVFSPLKITPPQAMILIHLHESGGCRLSELAGQLHMTCSNCSVICQRLEKSGLICRIRDGIDQRAVNLTLTQEASEMIQGIKKRLLVSQENLLKDSTVQEKETILKGLQLLNNLFEKKQID